MRVFSDKHHGELFESLRLLFVDRLGYELYCPIGKRWYTEGYWKIADPYESPEVAIAQYLEFDRPEHGAVTLEEFKETEFDILIASIPAHIEPYKELIRKYQPQAKLIFQVGNTGWSEPAKKVQNIMASAGVYIPGGSNFISYHQEFDLNIFRKGNPHQNRNIYSFIHCMSNYPDWSLFLQLERALSEFSVKSFGADCRDGRIYGRHYVADKMREAMWTIHLKTAEAEGYGHVIHNTFAVGRPTIVKREYLKGKIAEPLLLDGETCIFVDDRSVREIAEMVREFSKPERYNKMVDRCKERFDEVVDFDKEAEQIKEFLKCLK